MFWGIDILFDQDDEQIKPASYGAWEHIIYMMYIMESNFIAESWMWLNHEKN